MRRGQVDLGLAALDFNQGFDTVEEDLLDELWREGFRVQWLEVSARGCLSTKERRIHIRRSFHGLIEISVTLR